MDAVGNSSVNPEWPGCVFSVRTRIIFTSWFSVNLLLLPLFLFVLYIGFNKWRRPQSAAGGLSHSDVFTLHMVLMEMLSLVGACVGGYAFYTYSGKELELSEALFLPTFTGQMLFHSLTCVERYLAVVHPVSYLRLRREGGASLRNTCISVVWVLWVVNSLVTNFVRSLAVYGSLSLAVFLALTPVVLYCSVYVLCVLIRPKPGERGGLRRRIDQSRRSTVYTMAAILAALLLRLTTYVVYGSGTLWTEDEGRCVTISASLWVTLPSSLVLPLLFLQRAGKLR